MINEIVILNNLNVIFLEMHKIEDCTCIAVVMILICIQHIKHERHTS